MSGQSAYDRYCEHRERHHPGEEPMTCAESWRWRVDERDRTRAC